MLLQIVAEFQVVRLFAMFGWLECVQTPVGMDTFGVHGVCADTCRSDYIWGG